MKQLLRIISTCYGLFCHTGLFSVAEKGTAYGYIPRDTQYSATFVAFVASRAESCDFGATSHCTLHVCY